MTNVPLHLLRLIAAGAPMATPEESLRVDIRQALPRTSGAQINTAFATLESQRLAISSRDALSNAVKWSVTEVGQIKLAELAAL